MRNYCECYNTSGTIPGVTPGMSVKERAALTIKAGYRAFRLDSASLPRGNSVYNSHERSQQLYEDCAQAREGVGKNGDFCIDFHQRFDLSDAGSRRDPHRAPRALLRRGSGSHRSLRAGSAHPARHGERAPRRRRRVGQPLGLQPPGENHYIDFVRATLPNVGGITEMMKVAAMCETHFVGIVPHFTGPIATAALVNCLSTLLRPRPDGVQLRGPHPATPAGLSRFQGRQALSRTIARGWASSST